MATRAPWSRRKPQPTSRPETCGRLGARSGRAAVDLMRNPFIAGSWVRGDNFFGRSAILRDILEGERHALWVVGAQRLAVAAPGGRGRGVPERGPIGRVGAAPLAPGLPQGPRPADGPHLDPAA